MPHGRPHILRRDATARAAKRLALPLLATCSIAATAALPSGAAASQAAASATPALTPGASVTSLSPEALQQLLSQIAAGETGVPPEELDPTKLAELLSELPGFEELRGLAPGGPAEVEADLREVLEELLGGQTTLEELLSPKALVGLIAKLEETTHVPIAETIEALFGKSPQALLEEGLGSVDVGELLSKLLGSSEEPQQLLDHLLEALNPATLEQLLGTLPSGSPLENLTVGELASELGETPEELAQALGQTAAALPATAAVVTKTLENGQRLALIDGTEGLAAAVVGKGAEGVESLGNGGTPVGGHSGGGEGGPGGSPGTTTVVVTTTPRATPATAAQGGKLRLISRKVHGARATLVLQVPSAGRLTLSGAGVAKVTREAAKAERITIATSLTKARAASLRKHHAKHAKVVLSVAFAPASGAASKAVTSVTLR